MHEMQIENERPVVVISYERPFDPDHDVAEIVDELKEWAASREEGRIFVIHDVLKLELTFSQMVQALAKAFGKDKLDPRIVNYVITDKPLLTMGVNAVSSQDQYGRVSIQAFASSEDAMDAVADELAG